MELKKSEIKNVNEIYSLVQKTIRTVYSKYYAPGVVDFFCNHHSLERIAEDIEKGIVYIIHEDGEIVATGTLDGNHITRVFVNPEHQKKGIGTFIFDSFEKMIFDNGEHVELDTSLAASLMYEKRGYKTIRHETIECENGDILVYEVMEK